MTTTSPTVTTYDELLHAVATDGIAAHEAAVPAIAAAGVDAGAPAGLLAALCDTAGPGVARERALARVIGHVRAYVEQHRHAVTEPAAAPRGTDREPAHRGAALV